MVTCELYAAHAARARVRAQRGQRLRRAVGRRQHTLINLSNHQKLDDSKLHVISCHARAPYSRACARSEDSGSDAPWGVVSIKAQDVDREVPMQPITMLRNALGKDQGGSGVPLDADAYRESVAFWSEHATLA
eukprot:TRINITY_DN7815_c0_g1_i2.p1 TRINITY_DN7815_c0_g1~~TRINITY_DN7815_c0_g1_i2.p1  ORF type:complete len:133 (-),score=26.81 TRINITY_DN7815_c0_g1_i2:49-447(-)